MGQWFQKTKTPSTPPQSVQPQKTQQPIPQTMPVPQHSVQQLEQRIKRLEELLLRLTEKSPEIRIDALHIHQPVLENLTFRLDQLDIKELSGSLNLGNNFGAKPDHKEETTVLKKESGAKAAPKADSKAAPAQAPAKAETAAGTAGGAGAASAGTGAVGGSYASPAAGQSAGVAGASSASPSAGSAVGTAGEATNPNTSAAGSSAKGSSSISDFSAVSTKGSASTKSSASINPVTGYYAGRSPKPGTAPSPESSTERTATGYRYTPQPKSTGGV